MNFGYSETCLDHDTGDRHPEAADRLLAVREGLKRKHGVEYVDATPAPVDEITAIHDEDYIEELREFCDDGGGSWDPDTVAVEKSWDAILTSAGLAAWAAERALAGDDGRDTPFSIGRPPGHHAVTDNAMGFCFVNNVAVAAQHALDETDAESVAVLDWDVHHGNGTQEIFYDREDVFVVSVHEDGIYPGTGRTGETGADDGEWSTLNVPLPAGGGDPEYVAVFEELVEPAIEEFDPDLLLVSAGFDAHRHDPISRMRLTTDGYGVLTQHVRDLTDRIDGALAFVLKGGYGLDVLADGVVMVHEVFDGLSPSTPDGDIDDEVEALISDIQTRHRGVTPPN